MAKFNEKTVMIAECDGDPDIAELRIILPYPVYAPKGFRKVREFRVSSLGEREKFLSNIKKGFAYSIAFAFDDQNSDTVVVTEYKRKETSK